MSLSKTIGSILCNVSYVDLILFISLLEIINQLDTERLLFENFPCQIC